jgi:lysozyme
MHELPALYELIKHFEGLRLTPYLCPAGIPTIGYGHTGPDVSIHSKPITQDLAEKLLKQDTQYYIICALRLSPILLWHPKKHAAIADFCFNLGATRYKASTLRRCINRCDWLKAQEEIMKWVWGGGRKLPGLIARRLEEAKLLI